jgi:hypothetical protein
VVLSPVYLFLCVDLRFGLRTVVGGLIHNIGNEILPQPVWVSPFHSCTCFPCLPNENDVLSRPWHTSRPKNGVSMPILMTRVFKYKKGRRGVPKKEEHWVHYDAQFGSWSEEGKWKDYPFLFLSLVIICHLLEVVNNYVYIYRYWLSSLITIIVRTFSI